MLSLAEEMKTCQTYKFFEEMEDRRLKSLNKIAPLGYGMWIWGGDGVTDAKEYHDAWEWAKVRFKQLQKTDVEKMDEYIEKGKALAARIKENGK